MKPKQPTNHYPATGSDKMHFVFLKQISEPSFSYLLKIYNDIAIFLNYGNKPLWSSSSNLQKTQQNRLSVGRAKTTLTIFCKKECRGYDTELHLMLRLQFWGMWSTPSLLLLPGQIDLFENYPYLIGLCKKGKYESTMNRIP